ncbi:glycine betaine/L-proline ABC transporter substrate-binding protein ProX [Leptothoe kymatousa]|uniref:Glycine betaine/L-proline ABC transporter substrate-binding protein ProX n=1 Tax=Leptothoe kymatousa TAU-MAC 1615 TaxID=2364775 RepID=A0ABS5Y4C6_9CYAN|nr:glycine betaine/L-proline ABC transporter substrate-binding protein ProX [Leptothoe kymatousa]MBT9312667.1 glycine betaine/L-proline ABC transporter substrate-binding protein ProX [Leptothoe kymatousa TAU-MAC 1615]
MNCARPVFTGLAIALSLTACTSGQQTDKATDGNALPGDGVNVTASYGLIEELFQTEVVNIGLEQLGYTINKPKELEYASMHVDMANGGIDFTTAHWEKLHQGFFDNSGGDEKLERTGVYIPNVLQGYKIDKATADEYGITSLDQLKDPEIAALFDSDGDGKANLTGCNPGWGCELVIEHHLEEYGLRDTVQHDQGQYFALLADTMTRYDQGNPVLLYTWTPLWVHGVLKEGEDVTWLEVPYTSLPEEQGEVSEADTSAEGKNLGFGVDQQVIVANQTFVDENPVAATFFTLAKLPLDDVSAQNQLMENGEDSPEAIRGHAEAWVADNQAEFDSWVEGALAAK